MERAGSGAFLGVGATLALAAGLLLSPELTSAASRTAVTPKPAGPLTASLAAAASSTLGSKRPDFAAAHRAGDLTARGGDLETVFKPAGPDVRTAGGSLALRLLGVGRNGRIAPPAPAVPVANGNRIVYRHGALLEWYRNGPFGLEQGFTLDRRPAGAGGLTIAIGTSTGAEPRLADGQIAFPGANGGTRIRYGDLSAEDAAGKPLPARLALAGGKLLLRIDDTGARYPVTVDPFLQAAKLTATGAASFGYKVALSSDGTTALIGSPDTGHNSTGDAFVFVRTSTGWAHEGGVITGPPSTVQAEFGSSVAVSSDGSTLLIGADFNQAPGQAWVFTRSGVGTSTNWTKQQVLTSGSQTQDDFGGAVALSGDGNTALVGSYGFNRGAGATWVFVRSGTNWVKQNVLTGGGEVGNAGFGGAVALSADGGTALVGAAGNNNNVGAAWVFTRSGNAWTQQGSLLTASGEAGPGAFGVSTALSGDGNTALIGGSADSSNAGAAWVFTRSGTTWAQQGGKLTGGGESGAGRFGLSVALSTNGSTALVGGPGNSNSIGAAWVFGRSGTNWTQIGKLVPGDSGEDFFGGGVSLPGDGNALLVGGPGGQSGGAAWVFTNRTLLLHPAPVPVTNVHA